MKSQIFSIATDIMDMNNTSEMICFLWFDLTSKCNIKLIIVNCISIFLHMLRGCFWLFYKNLDKHGKRTMHHLQITGDWLKDQFWEVAFMRKWDKTSLQRMNKYQTEGRLIWFLYQGVICPPGEPLINVQKVIVSTHFIIHSIHLICLWILCASLYLSESSIPACHKPWQCLFNSHIWLGPTFSLEWV